MFRRDQICNHVPAAPAPSAQIPAPLARPSPQRCCRGNSMAMSICQTARRGAGRPPGWGGAGAPGRAEAAASGGRPGRPRASRPTRPPPPRHRFTERDIKGENGVSGARGVLE